MRLIDADSLIAVLSENICPSDAKKIKRYIDEQPTIGDWIPCSERLPDEKEIPDIAMHADISGNPMAEKFRSSSNYVDVTIEFETGSRIAGLSKTHCGKWLCEEYGVMKKVIAWKPRPEPYKG